MQTRRDTIEGSRRPIRSSSSVVDLLADRIRSNQNCKGRTLDLIARSSEQSDSDLGSLLKELTTGSTTEGPQAFSVDNFRAGVDTWRPAITPLPGSDLDVGEHDLDAGHAHFDDADLASAHFNDTHFNNTENGQPSYFDEAAPAIAPDAYKDESIPSAQSGIPHSATSWVRRGSKVAVATAFLTGVAGAAAAMPAAAADFGQSDASNDSTGSEANANDQTQTTVVVKAPPLGIGAQGIGAEGANGASTTTAAPVRGSKVQLQAQAPLSPTTARAESTTVTRQAPLAPSIPQQKVEAPIKAAPAVKQPVKQPVQVQRVEKPPVSKQPVVKQAPAPVPVSQPTADQQPAPKKNLAPTIPQMPSASTAEIFAADLQVKISKVVAEDAAAKAQQALSVARNASVEAKEKADAADSAGTDQSEADAAAAIVEANRAANDAQAAHYDAETKIRALEIAKTALAALTRTSAPTALPANPTQADIAVAYARAAIVESTAAADAANTAAEDAFTKTQAARKSPADAQLAETARQATIVAEEKQQAARNAELIAEAAVNRARSITA